MKYLTRLGLLGIAVAAVVAFGGVGTASATELCTVGIEPCPGETLESAGTALEATTTLLTITAGASGNITCTHSLIKGKTTDAGGKGKDVEATIESFTASGKGPGGECTNDLAFGGTASCTVSPVNLPWKAPLSKSALPDGTMTWSSSGKGDPGFTVKCATQMMECIFSATKHVLDFKGGKPALLKAVDEPLVAAQEGFSFCPSKGTWDATYTVLKPTQGYLVN
ncbi:MAG TPA: hypothetical protein VFN18_12305 [Solirubrobacterales bacterium]|nr:hypothetical protein [Solirubrobacterales bacterium]